LLVGAECDRSFLTAVDGIRGVPVQTRIGGSDNRLGSHHDGRANSPETLDC
jgi:hypothetical protein